MAICCREFVLIQLLMSGTKVIHRFIRNANIDSSIHNRVANRFAPFTNTCLTLQDPNNNRTLTLIGTTNSSTTLAHRTQMLLNKIKPDAVYVQTSNQWWQYAQHTNIDNQAVFSKASQNFPQPQFQFHNHLRGILYRLRYYLWKYTFKGCLQFPTDFRLFTPGLETYYACQYAQQNNLPQYYGGEAFDPITIEALRIQPNLYPHTLLWKAITKTMSMTSSYTSQYDDFIDTLHVRGGEAFSESLDRSRINFLVALLSKIVPEQKSILIDERDDRIFRDVFSLKHKNILAVVNQWHMEGVETHWRNATNTAQNKPQLSPVADMDIDAMQDKVLINEWLREYVSEVSKTEPATWQDYLTNYHKENFENERTRHTHHDSHEDIPEPGQKAHHH